MPESSEVVFELRVGAGFSWDGSWCTVVELLNGAVVVQDANRRLRRLHFAEVLRPQEVGGRARFPKDSGTPEPHPLALVWSELEPADREEVMQRAEHVREVMTGYKSGTPAYARPGEPRPEYAPDVPKMQRYRAKSKEVGIHQRTLSYWIAQYIEAGELGLIDPRRVKRARGLANLDPRWVDTALTILAEQVDEPKIARNIAMQRIKARLEREYGINAVKIGQVPGSGVAAL